MLVKVIQQKLIKKHSDHKAVCDRGRKYDDGSNAYVVFANSQPSAVDGLNNVL